MTRPFRSRPDEIDRAIFVTSGSGVIIIAYVIVGLMSDISWINSPETAMVVGLMIVMMTMISLDSILRISREVSA